MKLTNTQENIVVGIIGLLVFVAFFVFDNPLKPDHGGMTDKDGFVVVPPPTSPKQ